LGDKDLGKKPGFWIKAIAPQAKKAVFYQHFAWVTNMWLRNPVSGYKRSRVEVIKFDQGFLFEHY
jgi:hypothetical protein